MAHKKPTASGFIHPRSRKAGRIKHLEAREKKMNSQKRQTIRKSRPLTNMLKFFQESILKVPEITVFSADEIVGFISAYYSDRFEEDSGELRNDKRVKKVSLRSRMSELNQETLKNKLELGEVDFPDLRDVRNVENLKIWDGSEKSASLVKLVSLNELLKDTE